MILSWERYETLLILTTTELTHDPSGQLYGLRSIVLIAYHPVARTKILCEGIVVSMFCSLWLPATHYHYHHLGTYKCSSMGAYIRVVLFVSGASSEHLDMLKMETASTQCLGPAFPFPVWRIELWYSALEKKSRSPCLQGGQTLVHTPYSC